MSIRDVLAENFALLRERKPVLGTLPAITKAGGGTNGTLGRIPLRETGLSIDKLEPLAKVFEVEPWQLLAENLGEGQVDKTVNASLGDVLAGLATHLKAMDPDTRRKAMLLISDLETAPDTHATVAAMIDLSIRSKDRKVA